MRWESLFADLEAQFAAGEAAEFAAEVADRTRREVAALRLYDRLRAQEGVAVTCDVLGVGAVRGAVRHAGNGWLLLADDRGREALLAAAAMLSISGLGALAAVAGTEGTVAGRLGLGAALRALAERRVQLAASLVTGTTVHGVIERVGADFADVASGEVDAVGAGGRIMRTIPFHALALIRQV